MGHPADGSSFRVMHSVIVNMHGHTQDVERHVSRHNEEDAVFAITAIIVEKVDGSRLSPGAIDLEVNVRH